MRWVTFAIVAYVAIALEKGLMDTLAFHGFGSIRPSLIAVLLVFIALNGPKQAVLWAALILGVLMDLCVPLEDATGRVRFLIGPYALGYVFAAYMVLQLRPMVFRRRVLTQSVLAALAVLAAGVIAVAIFTVRSWYPEAADAGVSTNLRWTITC